jgi:hypothetical protein
MPEFEVVGSGGFAESRPVKLGRDARNRTVHALTIEKCYLVFKRNSLSFFIALMFSQRVTERMLSLSPIRNVMKQRARTE